MGWDAFARENKKNKSKFRRFKTATKKVLELCGSYDCLLPEGGLDCSSCGDVLAQVGGKPVMQLNGCSWSAKEVRRFNKNKYWRDVKGEFWAVLSARYFVKVCAEIGCGIDFCW